MGKVKAAWEYGNYFDSFRHGYVKELSKTTEKIQVCCMSHG